MWRIQFRQFRCWDNLLIEAPIGGITLVKGSSGVGKTTILQGITWCLYGNIRLVTPNHLEKAKTRVTIEFPYTMNETDGILTIDRQKDPSRLILTHNENTYEDKVAQSIIDDLFGNYDIWLASCYIGQGCRNSFLTAPNNGKMELLNSIAFHEEDPTTFIQRIDAAITETDAEYKAKSSIFTANLNALQALLATVDTSKALTSEQIDSINMKMETSRREIMRLNNEKTQREVNLRLLADLQRQIDNVRTTVIPVPKADDSLLSLATKFGSKYDTAEQFDASITQIMEIMPLLQRRDQLDAEVKQYDNLLLPYVNLDKTRRYTLTDYQDAVAKEIALRDSQKLAQSLGVLYSDSVIKETIQRHQNTLAAQERLQLERERDQLQRHINMLEMEHLQQATPLKFPDLTPQQILVPDYSKYSTVTISEEINDLSKKHGAIQAHIQHLQKGRDVLECPQCKGALRYQQGTLILAETAPANLDELAAKQQELTQITSEINRLNHSIQSLAAAEMAERSAYENAVSLERRRIDSLQERTRQLELENQRREIASQARAKQILELKDELVRKDESLKTMPKITGTDKLLSKAEVEQMHALIGRLAGITILSSPSVPSQTIQSYLTYQDLVQKKDAAITAHREYLETLPAIFRSESVRTLQAYVDRLRTYWNQVKQSVEERTRLERLERTLETQIASLMERNGPDPTPDINRITLEITELEQSLALSVKAHQVLQQHSQVTKEREEIVSLNTVLSDLQTFRQYAVETECHILQQVVDSINNSIQAVCGTLFDRDINIALSLFKTMKTNKNVKPIANFNISYQGGTFDNINQMSGGEGDRASLALTLALNRLSSCPLLMLDESLASLDLNMKEAAIRTIRENTTNTVLIIMHDGIEGLFQNVLNIDEMVAGRY